ncbi:VOC family protein [Falsihalocynthiibacter sp. SS001]|uniref:VOC family protein n=1 Tax=Falsihalocynthiibacter sp. SS001 TaxID=3349698 RepID=UPI0036D3FE55
MKLGAFSVSLNVKDIQASSAFYGKLGFEAVGGDAEQGWLILRNESTTIGLFSGMFPKNMLTFNPGWDANSNALDNFTDVRQLQKALEDKGIDTSEPIEAGSSGPASFMIEDPDGNPILFDQHR